MNNRQWTIAQPPATGWPTEGDFAFFATTIPEPANQQLCARTIYLSMDLYQWVRLCAGALGW